MSYRSATFGAWPRPRIYSAHLQPRMQDVLRMLADIDCEHDCALARLEQAPHDAGVKRELAERLRARHRERREPYVRMLDDIQTKARRKAGLMRLV